jgi:hypothetical protein
MKTILGYDPGGSGGHGVAALSIDDSNNPIKIIVQTQEIVKDVIAWFSQFDNVVGIGIDTLTKWATGESGWRPADLWLRARYRKVALSVVPPNALRGAMTIGGMAVKSWFYYQHPEAVVSETHPKVLYFALNKKKTKYDWKNDSSEMVAFLSEKFGTSCKPRNEHEFDSALSCYVSMCKQNPKKFSVLG